MSQNVRVKPLNLFCVSGCRFRAALLITLLITFPGLATAADDGPRKYWNGPVGLNVVQVYTMFMRGNTISSSSQQYDTAFKTNAELVLTEYDRIFDFSGRALVLTGVVTVGHVSTTVFDTFKQSTRGLGDLYLQGTLNLIGAPALSPSEFAAYEQNTILSLLVGVSAPIGQYDGDRLLNMGQNRWGLRVGMPFVQTLGDWIPGRITTLEIVPSAWFYSANNDYIGGAKLTQAPLYMIEAHLTRDLTKQLYASFDYFYQGGGETSVNGVKKDDAQKFDSVGVSLGYQINENSQLALRYSTPLKPNPDKDLDIDLLQINLNYVWW